MFLKRAVIVLALLSLGLLTSCGGGGGTNPNPGPPSGIKKRASVTNPATSTVFLIDYQVDGPGSAISDILAFGTPQQQYLTPDGTVLMVYDDSAQALQLYGLADESHLFDMSLQGRTESVVFKTSTLAYTAVPNFPVPNAAPGAVLKLDMSLGSVINVSSLSGARRLALSGDGKTLLAFANDQDFFWAIDLTQTTATLTAKQIATDKIPTLSRPYNAFFSSDSSKAYILNCGSGCGGSATPSVLQVDVASLLTDTPTAGTPIAVGGANIGLLDGSKLYVAGNGPDESAPGTLAGWFTSVDVAAGTAGTPVKIGDGFHTQMVKSDNNKVWIGALTCTNTTVGCLSIVDLSSNTVTNNTPQGPVTGMAVVPSRNIVYVCEGGELHNYDATSGKFSMPLDVIGYAYDVKILDK